LTTTCGKGYGLSFTKICLLFSLSFSREVGTVIAAKNKWLSGRLEKLQQLKDEGKFIRFAINQGRVAFDILNEREIQNEFIVMTRRRQQDDGGPAIIL